MDGRYGEGAAFTADSDTTLGALTPEGIEYTLHPAGLASRAAAFAMDTAIQWAVIIAAELVSQSMRNALGLWFLLLLMFVVDWFYHVAAETLFGQSPGKRLAGIRVMQSDGSPIRFASSMLRNLLRFADTFMALFQTAFLTMCLSRGFRRIGDLAAGTIVVYTSSSRFIRPCFTSSPADRTEAVAPVIKMSFEEKQALIMFARRYALLGDPRACEIIKPWTDALGFEPGDNGAANPAEYALGLAKNWTGSR